MNMLSIPYLSRQVTRGDFPAPSSSAWTHARTFWGIFFVALFTHALFALFVASTARPLEIYPLFGNDSNDYATIARTLIREGTFYISPVQELSFRRPPLYPLLIAGSMYLVGERNGPVSVIGVQLILFALATSLLYSIARFFLSQKQSVFVALLLILEPSTWYTTSILLSDSIFLFFIVASFFFIVRPHESAPKQHAYAGILMGLAALTRSIAQFFPLIAILYILCTIKPLRERIVNILLYVLGFFIIVSPWMLWSHAHYNSIAISTDSVAVHYAHTIPAFLAHETERPARDILAESRARIALRAKNENRTLVSLMAEESSRAIFERPFAYAQFHIIKSLPFFLSDGVREMLAHLHLINDEQPNIGNELLRGNFYGLLNIILKSPPLMLAILGACAWGVLWLGVFASFLFSHRAPYIPRRIVYLCLALILMQAALIGPAATPRHRMPALPFIFILAVPGVIMLSRSALSIHTKTPPTTK